MASAGIPLMMAGTAMSAGGQMAAGQAASVVGAGQQQASVYEAGVLSQRAASAAAAGSQQASIVAANRPFVIGSQRANAAAAGGTAGSPTAQAIMGNTVARSEYDQMADIYNGEVQARGYQNQAALDIYQGQQQLAAGQYRAKAARVGALTSVLSGFGNVAAKYGHMNGVSQSPGEYPAQVT
ncbi:MAG: hypothetical protein ACREDC_00115 [Bradyrhizobium sp.]